VETSFSILSKLTERERYETAFLTILGEDDGAVVSLAKSTTLSIVSSFLKFDRWTFRLKQD